MESSARYKNLMCRLQGFWKSNSIEDEKRT